MTLEHTVDEMKLLLAHLNEDLVKSEKGNKAASQRIRVNSIKLEKIFKIFRKESLIQEKSLKETN